MAGKMVRDDCLPLAEDVPLYPTTPSQYDPSLIVDRFIVRVLAIVAGTPQGYTFAEWEVLGDEGATVVWGVKTGGRIADTTNPGYTAPASDLSEVLLSVNDFALARASAGSGGNIWELTPFNPTSSSLSWKNVARCATTTNGTLSTAYANGSVIDGVTLLTGDRILIKDQSSSTENGIYSVNSSGAPTRTTDANTGALLVGDVVYVSEGTINGDSIWACTTNAPIIIGTTAIVWARVWPPNLLNSYGNSGGGGFDLLTDNVWTSDTGATISLPSRGTYFVWMVVEILGYITATPTGFIYVRLYNNTTSTIITGQSPIYVPVINASCGGTVTLAATVTTSGAEVVQLQGFRASGPTWFAATLYPAGIPSPANFGYIKIA